MFKFEKLNVWQKSLDLTGRIHEMTRSFPKEGAHILTAQIKRAADSICLNIAEGSTGQSNAEFRLFLGYAIRSTVEVVACLFVARKRAMIKPNDFHKVYSGAETIIRMLQALRKSLG